MGADRNRRAYKQDRHVRLFNFMTDSAAWLDLSGNAVKLICHLSKFENGSNNGDLFLSEREAATGIGVSKRTAGKLFDELESHGFIAATAKGHFVVKHGPATQWRLTWLPCPATKQGPTNEWRNWKPEEKTRAQLLHDTGEGIAPVATVHRTVGEEIAPAKANSADPMGAKSDPHTIAIGDAFSARLKSFNLDPDFLAGRSAANG